MSDRKIKVQREVSERPINVERESTLMLNATGVFPSGTLEITENGSYEVTTYKNVEVAVPSDPSEFFTPMTTTRVDSAIKVLVVDIPSTITEVFMSSGYSDFRNYGNLKKVRITGGSGLTSLNNLFRNTVAEVYDISALAGLTNVRSYNLFGNATNVKAIIIDNENVFDLSGSTGQFSNSGISRGTGYIYVPDELVNTYKAASIWSQYASQIKPLSELPEEYRS